MNLTFISRRCNDGSPAGYYLRTSLRPNNPSGVWVFYFDGGAYCFDNVSCSSRWYWESDYMTSKGWKNTFAPDGILKMDDVNAVKVNYCTSDDFVGNSTSPNTTDIFGKPVNFIFEGYFVVREIIDSLVTYHDLNSAKMIILSGASTGGVTQFAWADRIQGLLPQAKVVVVQDSGYFLDPLPFVNRGCLGSKSCSEQEGFRRAVVLWNSGGNLDESCEAALGRNNYRCLLGPWMMPYIGVRWLTIEFQYDIYALYHYGFSALPAVGSSGYEYIQVQAKNLTNYLKKEAKSGKDFSYISPACYLHGIIDVDGSHVQGGYAYRFNDFVINNRTVAAITGEWLDKTWSKQPVLEMDTCGTPNCNKYCGTQGSKPPMLA